MAAPSSADMALGLGGWDSSRGSTPAAGGAAGSAATAADMAMGLGGWDSSREGTPAAAAAEAIAEAVFPAEAIAEAVFRRLEAAQEQRFAEHAAAVSLAVHAKFQEALAGHKAERDSAADKLISEVSALRTLSDDQARTALVAEKRLEALFKERNAARADNSRLLLAAQADHHQGHELRRGLAASEAHGATLVATVSELQARLDALRDKMEAVQSKDEAKDKELERCAAKEARATRTRLRLERMLEEFAERASLASVKLGVATDAIGERDALLRDNERLSEQLGNTLGRELRIVKSLNSRRELGALRDAYSPIKGSRRRGGGGGAAAAWGKHQQQDSGMMKRVQSQTDRQSVPAVPGML